MRLHSSLLLRGSTHEQAVTTFQRDIEQRADIVRRTRIKLERRTK